MKRMHKQKIFAFGISMFLIITIFSGKALATELEIQTTKEYELWMQLPSEEKNKTLMPKTFSPDVPNEIFENEIRSEIPSLLNEMKQTMENKDQDIKLENVKATYSSYYNIADNLNLRVEHQGVTSECWAFSMLKSFETNIALRNGVKEISNFSERHMDYSTSKTFLDGINKKGFSREVGTGGLPVTALAYLVNGQGAVLESDMPFENNEKKISLSEIDKEVNTTVTKYVSIPSIYKEYQTDKKGNTTKVIYKDANGIEYTNQQVKSIRNMIKKHLVEDGAIPSVTAGNQQKYYNNPGNIAKATAYNCNNQNIVRDHAITIVGWDDTYSKDNFAEGAKPSTNGAYIVLNSYGEENFGGGYLYISYEDVLIETELYSIQNTKKKDFDNIYQADFYGGIYSIGTSSTSTGYFANVYKKNNSKQEIVTNIGVTLSDYAKLEIYINPENGALSGNKLIKIGETTSVLEPGYHRIQVTPTKIMGNEFSIIVKQKSEDGTFNFSIETPVKDSAYASVDSEKNSYISFNGVTWQNLSEVGVKDEFGRDIYDMKKTDVCVKVFVEENAEADNPEPDNPEPDNPEPDNPEPDNPEPDNPKPDNPEPDNPEPDNPEPDNPEPDNPEPDNPEPDNPEPDNPEPDNPEPDNPEPDNPEPDNPEPDNPEPDNPEPDNEITSEKYLIDENYIFKIDSETSISAFKKNIQTESNIKIIYNNEEVTDQAEFIKTGMKLILDDNTEYELIVRGDINGDGKVFLTDLSKLILHYNEREGFILTGSSYWAGDMNNDKTITLTDISQLIVLYNSK